MAALFNSAKDNNLTYSNCLGYLHTVKFTTNSLTIATAQAVLKPYMVMAEAADHWRLIN